LRESYQFSDERIAGLRFAPKPLTALTQWIYQTYGTDWDEDGANYGVLAAHEVEIRTHIKADFPELKEKQIKDALDAALWRNQLAILQKARALQAKIGADQHDDMNTFDTVLKSTGVALDGPAKKQISAAVIWKNPKAAKVIKKVHKNATANPLYGLFAVDERHAGWVFSIPWSVIPGPEPRSIPSSPCPCRDRAPGQLSHP